MIESIEIYSYSVIVIAEGVAEAGAGAGGPSVGSRRTERRRSSCIRRDPDDILRSLRAVKGELGRTLSLSGSTARRK